MIIDEAHNLVEAINNMYSVEISNSQIATASSQLHQYLEKYLISEIRKFSMTSHIYIKRLKQKNIKYIKQLLFIMQEFMKAFKEFTVVCALFYFGYSLTYF